MYQLTRGVLALMIGFIVSIVFGVLLLPLLRKLKASQSLSTYLSKSHKEKEGTPTMGGFIFIIPTILTIIFLCLTNKIEFSYNLGICLAVFIS